jgi:hypothetical protein
LSNQYVTGGIPNANGIEPPPEIENPAASGNANGAIQEKQPGKRFKNQYSPSQVVSQPKHIARRSRFAAQMARSASSCGSWQRSFSHRTPIGGAK